MRKNKTKNKCGRLVAVLLLAILLTISATQALVTYNRKQGDGNPKTMTILPQPSLGDNYFTWEDLFTDATKVDPTMSYNYEITGGFVKMKDTYALWTNPSWTRMKQITITNNAGETLYNYALHLTIPYDTDMRSDYGDLRFKHENSGDVFCDYWLETSNANNAEVWVKIPATPTGISKMYLFYGNPSATNQSNFYNVFTVCLQNIL